MIEVQWVGALAGVESLADEIGLRVFEGAELGNSALRADPQKQRTRIGRQTLGQVLVQCGEIDFAFADDGRHPGRDAFGPRNRDSVDAGMQDAVESAKFLSHLRRSDILTLPAKRVADAVDEVEEALLVPAHQIAGPDPGISLGEDIAQDLFLGLARNGVALVSAAGTRRIVLQFTDGFAGFVNAAANTEAVLVADRLAFVEVEGDQLPVRSGAPGTEGLWPMAPGLPWALNSEMPPSVAA